MFRYDMLAVHLTLLGLVSFTVDSEDIYIAGSKGCSNLYWTGLCHCS
uniref:Uncharacterized protein n=1 Tax=Arundo donax TaxID=35708 RepID=A0A0A9DWX8_ARUDO